MTVSNPIHVIMRCAIKILHCNRINKRALGPWVAHLRMTDQWSRTICGILVECIMRNKSVIFF